MSEKFKASYEINDGYAGRSRPQNFTINAGDIEEDMSDDDLLAFYEEACEEHMRERIGITTMKHEQFLAWARAQIEALLKEPS